MKFTVGAAVACVGAVFAPQAEGVIVSGVTPMARPVDGFVGQWNGSSCVAVSDHWFVSAKHVGGNVGQSVWLRDRWYVVTDIRLHPNYDVQLLHVDETLPGWHNPTADAQYGDPCVLGGFGVTTTAALANNAGYDWNGNRVETWGNNVIEGGGSLLAIRFDPPSSSGSVPKESTFAVNDSGAGLFVYGADGSLQLAGVAVSVMNWGTAPWNTTSFSLNVSLFKVWMDPIIAPGRPVSAGVLAPRAALGLPGVPGWVGGMTIVMSLSYLRRRERSMKTL